jgi:hypothetical protein
MGHRKGIICPTTGLLNFTPSMTHPDPFALHPIRSEADYEAALKRTEAFFDAEEEPDPNSEEGAFFEALITLIQAYEAKHFSVVPPVPIGFPRAGLPPPVDATHDSALA